MAQDLRVELVAADREVWSGEARLVVAKTTEGEIGIMVGHEPVLALLQPGMVAIRAAEGEDLVAAVSGGYISVSENTVQVLAESVVLAGEVNVAEAETDLARARDAAHVDAERWARARLRVAAGLGGASRH